MSLRCEKSVWACRLIISAPGQSSLLNFRRFPISGLKIDQKFIQQLEDSPEGELLTRTLVDLAHHLQLPATAEGIETPGQLRILRANRAVILVRVSCLPAPRCQARCVSAS